MDTLRWLRVVGDTLFAVGILVLGCFVAGLYFGWSFDPAGETSLTGHQTAD